MFRKSQGSEAKLGYLGHVLMANRNGLLVQAFLTEANRRLLPRRRVDLCRPRSKWLRSSITPELRGLVTPKCPFVNLPETRKPRWGDAVDAEKMKNCVWVRPELVAQIEFLGWTDAGNLRHSKFAGLRDDKDARQVEKEP